MIEYCISIRQPQAWALCAGVQLVEYFEQATDYRGAIAIHAATTRDEVRHLLASQPEIELAEDDFAYGAIIGVAELVDCLEFPVRVPGVPEKARLATWKFEDPQLLREPLPLEDQFGLTPLVNEDVARVEAQLRLTSPMIDGVQTRQILQIVRPD